MTTLSTYVTRVRQLLKDPNGATYNTTDLTTYINEARNQVALDGECVRFLWQYNDAASFTLAGAVSTAGSTLLTGFGSVPGVANGQLLSGAAFLPTNTQVQTFDPVANTVTMTLPALSSAGATALKFTPLVMTATGQEIYPYPQNVLTSQGYRDVIQVKSISVNWGGVFGVNKYMLERWSFTQYQAFLGYYGTKLLSAPAAWVEYNGQARLRPVPSQAVPMEWDTVCSVIDLASDSDPDAVPSPFSDVVKYFAAYLAFLNSQRHSDADQMYKKFELFLGRARSFRQRTIVPYVYR